MKALEVLAERVLLLCRHLEVVVGHPGCDEVALVVCDLDAAAAGEPADDQRENGAASPHEHWVLERLQMSEHPAAHRLVRETAAGCAEIVVKVRDAARARDRTGDGRMSEDPLEEKLGP